MKKFLLTISREFGCNAREISRQIASRLNMELHDRDLITKAAERAGINRDEFADSDGLLDKNVKNVFKQFSFGSSTSFFSERAVMAQAETIKELAENDGPQLFFGRCADYFLRSYPNRLNIFLYAPKEYRIAHMAEAYGLKESEAARIIKRIDREKHNYYKYVTGLNRGSRDTKQLMIDVSEFGTEGAVDMVCYAVHQRFGD